MEGKVKKKGSISYAKWGYIFIAPFFLIFAVFQLIPMASTIYYSFFEYYRSGLKVIGPTFVGLKNYITLFATAPAVFFFMKQYLDSSLPMEIVEAARIDGAGEFYIFNKIVLPIMKPALAVQAIFAFVSSWNNYFIPALVLDTADKKTLPILIAQLRSADFLKFDMGKVYMMVAIAILPVIIVYLLLSKFIVRGVALGGVKG